LGMGGRLRPEGTLAGGGALGDGRERRGALSASGPSRALRALANDAVGPQPGDRSAVESEQIAQDLLGVLAERRRGPHEPARAVRRQAPPPPPLPLPPTSPLRP